MLEVAQLSCARGERLLFSNVSFSLNPGEWLHVQGSNGAGKTSLLRQLVGLAPREAGQILWQGHPIHSPQFRNDILYLGHHAAVKEDLTPWENLHLASMLDGGSSDLPATLKALQRLGLRGRENLPVRVLSAGQKRRVLLTRLLIRPAKLWVLDEAFNALDVSAVALLGGLIAEHLGGGGMAVLTSHQALPVPGGKTLTL
ncbi:MAG: cytochrome c biogenesis heme-transporting ATPase CcmA [Rhodocyclaceae bacterium]|nr:cytochrome c biogenesis heme-transporting ATPase CcmA [Rhodocyclaceae bacterium]MBK6905864.1 cytochrome c biogenesis heme-transporting ATPase CcmA [Rhodocyclaceae bacterium]